MPGIAFCGPQKAGKSTAAKYLEAKYGYVRKSFAHGLRLEVAQMMHAVEPRRTVENFMKAMVDGRTKDYYRPGLQWWGSYRRAQNSGYWIDKAFEDIKKDWKTTHYVFDDCRYANEAKACVDYGIKLILIERPDIEELQIDPKHESEQDWRKFSFDTVVENTTDLAGFHLALEHLAETLDARFRMSLNKPSDSATGIAPTLAEMIEAKNLNARVFEVAYFAGKWGFEVP